MLKQHDFKQPRNADKVQSELKTEAEIKSAGITALRFCVGLFGFFHGIIRS